MLPLGSVVGPGLLSDTWWKMGREQSVPGPLVCSPGTLRRTDFWCQPPRLPNRLPSEPLSPRIGGSSAGLLPETMTDTGAEVPPVHVW